MKKQTQTIWERFINAKPKQTFASATTAEGDVVSFDGELVEGTVLTIELEGVPTPAPEGEHQLTLEDGSVVIVTLDALGAVVSLAPVNPEDMDSDDDSVKVEVAEALSQFAAQINDRFVSIEKENGIVKEENKVLKAELEALKEAGKFGASPKKTDAPTGKIGASELLKLKK